jgi:selenocysteine lyase/cysteine desulfurase
VLYGKRDRLEDLDVPKLQPAPENAPERAETGTQNHEGIVGAAAAVDYLASLATPASRGSALTRRARLQAVFATLHERGRAHFAKLWDGLSGVQGVQLFGPPRDAPRTPTLAFTVKDRPSVEVSRHLADRGIFASHGDFYAMTAVKRLGVADQGLVRLGCACYTTSEEVARVIDAVGAVARGKVASIA